MGFVKGQQLVMMRLRKMAEDLEKRRFILAMTECLNYLSDQARENHPWETRTGQTDATTRGDIVQANLREIVGAVSAGMNYDVFLELSRNGKWSWLWPIFIANQEEIMAIFLKHGALDAYTGLQALTQELKPVDANSQAWEDGASMPAA